MLDSFCNKIKELLFSPNHNHIEKHIEKRTIYKGLQSYIEALSFIITIEEVISAIFDRSFLKFRTRKEAIAVLRINV